MNDCVSEQTCVSSGILSQIFWEIFNLLHYSELSPLVSEKVSLLEPSVPAHWMMWLIQDRHGACWRPWLGQCLLHHQDLAHWSTLLSNPLWLKFITVSEYFKCD